MSGLLQRWPLRGKCFAPTTQRASRATKEECTFLARASRTGWSGERVELNAMDSQQLLDWLEGKLQHYVKKVIPSPATLAKAYCHETRRLLVQRAIHKVLMTLPDDEAIVIPAHLAAHVHETLATEHTLSWDENSIVCNEKRDTIPPTYPSMSGDQW
ncbi:MAG: hypothetical protein HY267_06680 [Deltaproteobacteria bacterium]|nr:hypothetical protein [Deltaproteobacteria bacterium]